jgi:hypothetical protein
MPNRRIRGAQSRRGAVAGWVAAHLKRARFVLQPIAGGGETRRALEQLEVYLLQENDPN